MMLKTLLWITIGYLFGSIPWSLFIGKKFFDTDIREHGSGNLGGTNAARVLGFPVGAIVIVLDALKAFIAMSLCQVFEPQLVLWVGLTVCIGHCFPVFAGFKGGKAVASTYGYLFGIAMYVTHEWVYGFIIPLTVFFVILLMFRMVSLASMVSVAVAGILMFIFVDRTCGLIICALALFVIYRHSANIKRILNGTESKINLGNKKSE